MSNKKEHEYEIGDIFHRKYGTLKINKKIRINRKNGLTEKGYNVTCQTCTYTFDITENHLREGCGCSVCSKHKVLTGYNDIWTTNPELANILLNPEDGYMYTENSNKRVDWKCPDCGEPIYNKIIQSINKQGLSCPKCGDGKSYPNKFMYHLLKQLEIDFEPEKQFDWCIFKKYNSDKSTYGLYDFVIENMKLIIEMDGGLGHGHKTFMNQVSIDECVYRDLTKNQLAIQHGYKIIRVNCYYTNISMRYEVCKNEIIKNLSNILNLQNVNWDQIHKQSLNSYVVEICNLYKEGLSTVEIANIAKFSQANIIKYLKQGTECGFCNYTAATKFNKAFLIAKGYANIRTREELNEAKIDFICNYYNSNPETSCTEIAKIFNISLACVWKFLKIGTERGLCNYIKKDTRFKKNHIYHNHTIRVT